MAGDRDRQDSPWLDTETKAMLHPAPPDRPAALDMAGFTLVLLTKGLEPDRLARALRRIWRDPERSAAPVLLGACPIVLRSGLALDEAIVGQFELICCDSIAVFLQDGVAAGEDTRYLRELYSQLRRSPEFQPVFITIRFVPDTDAGRRFCDQFLSDAMGKNVRYGSEFAMRDRAFRKKARMMAHWASEIGAKMTIDE